MKWMLIVIFFAGDGAPKMDKTDGFSNVDDCMNAGFDLMNVLDRGTIDMDFVCIAK
jgi:hypothetical protein